MLAIKYRPTFAIVKKPGSLNDRAIANFVNLPQGDAHSLSMMAEDPELRSF